MPNECVALGCTINYESAVEKKIEIHSLEQDDNGKMNNKPISTKTNKAMTV